MADSNADRNMQPGESRRNTGAWSLVLLHLGANGHAETAANGDKAAAVSVLAD